MKSKYGTTVMKDIECLMFVQTAIENGADPETALQDMRMIDNLFATERNHLIAFGHINKTKAGRYRKGTSLYDALDNVISARAEGIEM